MGQSLSDAPHRRRGTRLLGCVALAFLVLVGVSAGLWFARSLIDADALAERLVPLLAERTGYEISIDRARSVGVRGLDLEGLRVSGALAGGCLEVEAQTLGVRWQLAPLLERRVVIERIDIASPRIRMVQLCPGRPAQGRAPASSTRAPQPAEGAEPLPPPESGSGPAIELMIAELALRDGHAEVLDTEDGEVSLSVGPFKATLEDLRLGQHVATTGRLIGDAATVGGLTASRVRTDLQLEAGVLRLEDLALVLEQGEVRTQVAFDLTSEPLEYELESGATIDLDLLLAGEDEPTSAMGTAELLLTGSGSGTEPRGLTARGTALVPQGRLGSSPITVALALATGIPELAQLEYQATETAFAVADGELTLTEPLAFRALESGSLDGLRLEIAGGAGLDAALEPSLDLRIAALVPRSETDIDELDQLLALLEDEEGLVEIPLTVRGSLADPKVRVDRDALSRAAGRGATRELGRRLFRKLGELIEG